ncbi:SDR family oxidoreductase, partial [Falsiroseomonas oryzae]|uniref:SDR family oxidoreductase n=1 Tax=Falsiroseomonas oryzae TaxID=2766473 RepID=UPI0022EADC0C
AEPIEASYHMVAIKGRRHDRTRAAQASRDDHACRAGTVQTWSKGLSREVAGDGVTINCLQPGRIRSEQMAKRYPTPEAEQEFAEAEIPAKRFGEAAEIADLAVFLASARAAYVTGTVIPVDGGMSRFAF